MRLNNQNGPAASATVITISITLLMLVWALNFLAGKIILRYIAPLTSAQCASYRRGIHGPAGSHLPPSPRASGTPPRRFTWRDYWTRACLGLFGFVVNQICFATGLHL